MTAVTAAPRLIDLGRSARRDGSVRHVVVALVWAVMMLPTYWWAAGGGITDLGGWTTGLDSLGRLTGLWCSVLLLVQVLAMARVPWLERAVGQDRIARLHRLTGLTSFNLMVAHIVLITWGYAAGRPSATPGTLWDLSVNYPGMLLAVGSTVCLVMVVVTSIKAARRRLRYESWHLLHLYAYLGVGLALPHQLWTGTDFVGSTGRTVFWWTLWGAAAGAVVLWRLLLPAYVSIRHGLRVMAVVPEGPGVISIWMTGSRLDRLRVEPGQFFVWRFLGPGWTRGHPFSLSMAPDGKHLRITVQNVGDGSAHLARLQPGTRVLIEGPYGRLSPRVQRRPKVAFIGAGVGIAPLRALAEGMTYDDGVLLHRYRDTGLFGTELGRLAAWRRLRVVAMPGSRRAPGSWLGVGVPPMSDGSLLLKHLPDLVERDVYVCGPASWVDALSRAAQAAGLPRDQLHVELFGW